MSHQQTVTKSITQQKLSPPSKYSVVLHNDDYTTMEFVIEVLMLFFGYDQRNAAVIMLAVHEEGRGVCGIYPAEIAETKVMQVRQYAKQHEFPLRCTMEKIES